MQNQIEKPLPTVNNGAGTLAEQHDKESGKNLNAEALFSSNPDQVFKDLSENSKDEHKKDEHNIEISAEKIKADFADTLANGKTVEEAWDYAAKNHAETVAIINGLLKFFAGPKGIKEIPMNDFLKPLERSIAPEGSVTQLYLERRRNFLAATKQAFQDLKASINKQA